MATDGRGHVFLALSAADGGGRVFKLSENGAVLGGWGGGGSPPDCLRGGVRFPQNIDVDALGNVYVPVLGCARVHKFDANGTFLTSWGTYGSADGQFGYPRDIAIGSDRIYVLEDNRGEIGPNQTRVQMFYSSHTYPRASMSKRGARAASPARR
jgi:DNA-binding beta-propeller fold protein YncE